MQINMGKRIAAINNLNHKLTGGDSTDIIFIQEPYSNIKNLKGRDNGYLFHSSKCKSFKVIRSAVWVKNSLLKDNISDCILLEQFSDRDHTTIRIKFRLDNGETIDSILCSVYCPSKDCDDKLIENPISPIINKLINFCKSQKLELMVAGDFNAHSDVWGDHRNDCRGKNVLEFIYKNHLLCLNRGSAATFAIGGKESCIDLTIVSARIRGHLKNWQVCEDYSGSDHRVISYELSTSKITTTTYRNRRRVNWKKYEKIFKDRIENVNFDCQNVEELDEAATKFRNILINTYEDSCKLIAVKDKYFMNWYNDKLHEEKKVVRKTYRRATNKKLRASTRAKSWKLYVSKNKTYVKNCEKAKSNNWKNNVTNLDNIKDISRLQKLLENSFKNKIGSPKLNDGTHTDSTEETIKHLMLTHFPDCSPLNENLNLNGSSKMSDEQDWEEIEEIIDDRKIEWAVESLKPYKAPGEDGIFPALLHHIVDYVVPIMKKLFRCSLRLSYIPLTWRGTYVAFIPKPGKLCYDEANSYRPISLMSFILKVLEKLIDKYIREDVLIENQLNKSQHAYQKGKSTESALHAFISRH